MIVLSVLLVVLVAGALVDVVRTPVSQVKRGTKGGWLLAVLLLPVIGGALWFAFGRRRGEYDLDDETTTPPAGDPHRAAEGVRSVDGPAIGAYAEPELSAASPSEAEPGLGMPPDPERPRSTEEQLADLEAEIAYWDEWARRNPTSAAGAQIPGADADTDRPSIDPPTR